MIRRLIQSLIFGLCTASGLALAQESPEAMVKRAVGDVTQILKADKEIRAGSRQRLNALVDTKILPYVDIVRMTRSAAGRHWARATPEQQQALTREFKALLTNTYAGAFTSFRDDTVIEYKPARGQPADNEAVVRSVISPDSREPILVNYYLEKIDGTWKVTDFDVMGVRLVETYKNQFNTEASANGVDGLIRKLAEKNRAIETRSKA